MRGGPVSFDGELKTFSETCFFRTKEAFVETAQECLTSIQSGSAITAAPGQPVDTGVLRASWQLSFPTETIAVIGTNIEYAQYIEDGMNDRGQFTLRSAVGGFHSVALTIAGFYRIVAIVAARVKAK